MGKMHRLYLSYSLRFQRFRWLVISIVKIVSVELSQINVM
jgi:hypothetical protein